MIFSEYVSRMEAANMKLNAYIKAGTQAILAFSESLSNILNPYYPIVMSRKEFRKVLAGTGLKKYEITERLFPKKKKRGSMRRARRDREIANFVRTMPENVYIDEWESAHSLGTSASIDITDDQFDGDPVLIIPGPFEGGKLNVRKG